MINRPNFISFSKILLTAETRLTGSYFLVEVLSRTSSKKRITDKTFQKVGEKKSSRHILKMSASMYKGSGLKLFKTTISIQSGPNTFHNSVLHLLDQLGSYRSIMQFQISYRRERK